MRLEEFLKPLSISRSAFAIQLGVSLRRLNEIIREKRGETFAAAKKTRAKKAEPAAT